MRYEGTLLQLFLSHGFTEKHLYVAGWAWDCVQILCFVCEEMGVGLGWGVYKVGKAQCISHAESNTVFNSFSQSIVIRGLHSKSLKSKKVLKKFDFG